MKLNMIIPLKDEKNNLKKYKNLHLKCHILLFKCSLSLFLNIKLN